MKPSKKLIKEFNQYLEEQGTNLRYQLRDNGLVFSIYALVIVDKFLELENIVQPKKEFDELVRKWFSNRGVDDLGFTNTIKTIFSDN